VANVAGYVVLGVSAAAAILPAIVAGDALAAAVLTFLEGDR
jgi:hypothetical protein